MIGLSLDLPYLHHTTINDNTIVLNYNINLFNQTILEFSLILE